MLHNALFWRQSKWPDDKPSLLRVISVHTWLVEIDISISSHILWAKMKKFTFIHFCSLRSAFARSYLGYKKKVTRKKKSIFLLSPFLDKATGSNIDVTLVTPLNNESNRSIFQTFWKVHCVTKSLFFELETSNFGCLLIFSFCWAVKSFSKIGQH